MKILQETLALFEAHRNPDCAAWHYAYMRKQFPFLGIQQPLRKKLQKTLLKKLFTAHTEGSPIITSLWELDEREYQYLAMDVLSYEPPREEDFPLIEKLIIQKSWWDTVDILASKHCGTFFKKFPAFIKETERWIQDKNLWLRRSAILFQLRYKKETNEKRLFAYCSRLAGEKEFFIQRAITWALREYAKTSPLSVKALLKTAPLQKCNPSCRF